MKIRIMMASAIALAVAFTGVARAADDASSSGQFPYGQFGGKVGFVSDYRFRGISQSNQRPAVQGSLDWMGTSGFYAGLWGSNIDLHDSANNTATLETDIYAGYKFALSGLNFDTGLIAYLYPGMNGNADFNYGEIKGVTSYDFGFMTLSGGLNYSPDYMRGSGSAIYTSFGGTVPVMKTGVSIVGTYGHEWIDNNTKYGHPNYSDWSLGATYKYQGFDLTGKYVDTSLSDSTTCKDLCDAAGVFSVSRTF